MGETYPRLFSPLTIGPVTAPNRVVFGAHFTMFTEPGEEYGEPGYYGARYAAYLAARARGGAGIVIAGQAQVHPTTAYQMQNNAIAWDPKSIPGFQIVTDAVHEHGALAFLQLAHNGPVNHSTWSRLPVWGPGPIVGYSEPAITIGPVEIAQVVDGFARSAANAAAGGFDGIEVHAAHGYLLHAFLSPKTNHRDDEYGGSLENRMRLTVDVLRAVRAAVGAAVAVGVRLVGDEETRDGSGLTAADAAEIAAALEAAGLVDFVDVSVGTSGMGMVRPVYAKHLLGVYAAKTIKDALDHTPVFAVHRILTPAEAEGILERDEADAVTVVRALIADEDWAAKARRGGAEEIRACTGCNQGCYGNLTTGWPVTCSTNPTVGRERRPGFGDMEPAAVVKRVVVVGGGPAGLEAARVAATRGHAVVLLERDRELGGKVRLAAQLPGRAELAAFATWRAEECARQGVDVRLGVDATADAVLALKPDAVVIATGARATRDADSKYHPMPILGWDQPFVIDHERAVWDAGALEGPVVLVDAVGHIEGAGVSHLLALAGLNVTYVSALPQPAMLDNETMAKAISLAARAGVDYRPNTVVVAIGDHEVTVANALTYAMETLPANTVVIRTHGAPRHELADALAGRVPELHCVGDAVAARLVDRAIFDGYVVGRSL
jgi:2,4-dienoyl-CoA reductase-like NADH-dependent reductase (Old Yellow Enzyme family)